MSDSEYDTLRVSQGDWMAQRSSHAFSERQKLFRACAAELITTMLFVVLSVTSVMQSPQGFQALAEGLLIFVLNTMTANVSGGHMNPAVSLGAWLAGEIGFVRFILYFLAQLIGACLGGALALGLNGKKLMESIQYGTQHIYIEAYSDSQAMGIMIFTTFVLVTTFLAANGNGFESIAPLCIGLAVSVGILVSGRISGGSTNPARSFGPAVASLHAQNFQGSYYDAYWKDQWIYFVGPLLGGVAAGIIYRFFFSKSKCSVMVRDNVCMLVCIRPPTK